MTVRISDRDNGKFKTESKNVEIGIADSVISTFFISLLFFQIWMRLIDINAEAMAILTNKVRSLYKRIIENNHADDILYSNGRYLPGRNGRYRCRRITDERKGGYVNAA